MVPFVAILSIIAALIPISGFGLGTVQTQWRSVLVYGACLVISALLLAAALATLILGAPDPSEIVLPLGVPWIGMHFRIDALAAFFLFVVNLGGGAASLYAIGYGRHETAPNRVLPFYPAFLAAMNLVVLAGDAFTFLLSWELMSLTSWALVMSHHRESGNTRAGYVYLIMASFGTLALLLAFGLLAGPDGGYAFATMRTSPHTPAITILVLALALLGAGSKAGLVPLHVWLPLAHPAAPSHVSALMSGVMTKVAIYGFVRIVFDLMGQPAWWAGMVVMALGGLTAWLGVLTAMMTSDLKRLLAYSTIENVGIIFIGLGLALAFRSSGMTGAAALAFTATLFHVLNHALFKSLLFFGAGAVLTSTGERDIERMGGLIHRMPLTAGAVLVGCAAISALPPFNGFASEWLTFQAILLSPALPQWGLRILIPAIGAILALAAALAAACFVRAYGTAFLGRPRSPSAAEARPTDRFSLAAMLLLASLCLLAGILPGPIIDRLAPVSQALVGGEMPAQAGIAWLAIVPINESRSSYDGLLVFVFVGLSALLSSYAIHSLASRKLRRVPAWDCGYPEPSPLTQYSAASFSQPIRRVFGTIAFRARERVTMPGPGDNSAATFRLELHDQVWEGLYVPIARAIAFAADHLNHLQFLTIRRYLSLVFAALVILLVILAMWL
jgi:hydrogenase-4 component B